MDEMRRLSAFLFGFAPRSALVCSAEGDPPGDGGAPGQQQPPQPAPAAPASGLAFTPEQLAYIETEKAKAANAAAAATRRAEEAKHARRGGEPAAPPTPSNSPPAPSQPTDTAALLQLRDDFDDAMAELTLEHGQKKFIRNLVMEKRPPDVAAFVKDTVTMLGIGKPASPAPAPAAPPASPPPAAPPPTPGVTSRGVPPPAAVPGDDVPILSMSIPERHALRAKIGDAAFAERNEREMKARNVRVRPLV